jgi:dUTP pyrophosphatase
MSRGFKLVDDKFKEHSKVINVHGERHTFYPDIKLPQRADAQSAGYDFYSPIDFKIDPKDTFVLWTNVKAYMEPDEVLELHVRSSIGIKKNVTLANVTGIIDASYYENPSNDGNIGLALRNNTGITVEFKKGDRIAQGLFKKYLVAEGDAPIKKERTGGSGSSGD